MSSIEPNYLRIYSSCRSLTTSVFNRTKLSPYLFLLQEVLLLLSSVKPIYLRIYFSCRKSYYFCLQWNQSIFVFIPPAGSLTTFVFSGTNLSSYLFLLQEVLLLLSSVKPIYLRIYFSCRKSYYFCLQWNQSIFVFISPAGSLTTFVFSGTNLSSYLFLLQEVLLLLSSVEPIYLRIYSSCRKSYYFCLQWNQSIFVFISLVGYWDLPPAMAKLKNLNKFDAEFFGIHSKSAETLDPQLRHLLEVAYEAVVDAGIRNKPQKMCRSQGI